MRYEIMWEREESLSGEIKTAWEDDESIQSVGDVAMNLGRVMTSLKRWSKEKLVQYQRK
jgi:hypothetical protein